MAYGDGRNEGGYGGFSGSLARSPAAVGREKREAFARASQDATSTKDNEWWNDPKYQRNDAYGNPIVNQRVDAPKSSAVADMDRVAEGLKESNRLEALRKIDLARQNAQAMMRAMQEASAALAASETSEAGMAEEVSGTPEAGAPEAPTAVAEKPGEQDALSRFLDQVHDTTPAAAGTATPTEQGNLITPDFTPAADTGTATPATTETLAIEKAG